MKEYHGLHRVLKVMKNKMGTRITKILKMKYRKI